MSKLKIRVAFGIKACISILAIWLLLRRLPVPEILRRMHDVDLWPFFFAVALAVPTMQFAAWRWKVISGSMLTLREAAKYTWIGSFYGAVLPGGISGDVAKGASLALKDPRKRAWTLPVTIVIDRFIGLYSLLVFLHVGCALMRWGNSGSPSVLRDWALAGWILSGVTLLVGLVPVWPAARSALTQAITRIPGRRLRAAINHMMITSSPYLDRRGALLAAVGLGCVSHALSVAQYFLMLRALGVEMKLAEAIAFYAMVSVAVLIPISISGIGIRDWVSLLFFTSINLDRPSAVAFSWLQLAGGLIVATVGGLVQVWELGWRSRTR
ncbi:MAG: lysylphosphatidylglycerol synthase transmembrane domain-containing protein [Chthoniobacterales bacterium]